MINNERMSLVKNEKSGWIREYQQYTQKEIYEQYGDSYVYFIHGEMIKLPTIFGRSYENIDLCKKYQKENPNFAYERRTANEISIFDSSVAEYEEHSGFEFTEIYCGDESYKYMKSPEEVIHSAPTLQMVEAATRIFCDFMEFVHKNGFHLEENTY